MLGGLGDRKVWECLDRWFETSWTLRPHLSKVLYNPLDKPPTICQPYLKNVSKI
jgi:hypothetical protein